VAGSRFRQPAEEFNRKARLFFWGVGSAEDGIHRSVNQTLSKLADVGINYVYKERPVLAHEWRLWRRCLNDFAPRLFH
jgi:enterochelin esterase-like enzyme